MESNHPSQINDNSFTGCTATPTGYTSVMAAEARFERAYVAVKVRCLTTWLLGNIGAGDRIRTDIVLSDDDYKSPAQPLCDTSIWWGRRESNPLGASAIGFTDRPAYLNGLRPRKIFTFLFLLLNEIQTLDVSLNQVLVLMFPNFWIQQESTNSHRLFEVRKNR